MPVNMVMSEPTGLVRLLVVDELLVSDFVFGFVVVVLG